MASEPLIWLFAGREKLLRMEETNLTNEYLEEQITKGFKLLKKFIDILKPPYWYKHIKLEEMSMPLELFNRVKLDEERGRPDNKFLEDKKAMIESLKKGLYSPLVTQGTKKQVIIHAGRHRYATLKKLVEIGEISKDTKIPIVSIDRKHCNEEVLTVEVPKPISEKIKIISEKPIEGSYKTNFEVEKSGKNYVKLTNGEYYFTALNLISQRNSYYLYRWNEKNKKIHPFPKYLRYI